MQEIIVIAGPNGAGKTSFANEYLPAIWLVLGMASLLLGISIVCLRTARTRPWLAVGWFWYVGMMVPVIGLVQVGPQAMADRYTYLPLIGMTIAVTWAVSEFWPAAAAPRSVVASMAVVALAASAMLTARQLRYWRDTVTLFDHTLAVTGKNPGAHLLLAIGLQKQEKFDQAAAHYRAAFPVSPLVHCYLANVLAAQQKWAEAAEEYGVMTGMEPENFDAQVGLANALTQLGRYREVRKPLEAALHSNPNAPAVLNNLAWLLATCPLAEVRDGPRAVAAAERACGLTEYKQTMLVGTLGAAYAEAGRFDEAVATAERACKLAQQTGEKELLEKNKQLLELYRAGKAARE